MQNACNSGIISPSPGRKSILSIFWTRKTCLMATISAKICTNFALPYFVHEESCFMIGRPWFRVVACCIFICMASFCLLNIERLGIQRSYSGSVDNAKNGRHVGCPVFGEMWLLFGSRRQRSRVKGDRNAKESRMGVCGIISDTLYTVPQSRQFSYSSYTNSPNSERIRALFLNSGEFKEI